MLPSAFCVPLTLIPLPAFTLVVAAALAALSWSTLTASVPSVPSATLVILLPPLFRPSLVKLTFLLGSVELVIATPSLSSLVLPVCRLPSLPRLIFLASFAVSVPLPSDSTPMLLSISLLVSVTPPLIVRVSPNLRVEFAPLSPAKVMGLITSAFKLLRASPTLLAGVYDVPSVLVMV